VTTDYYPANRVTIPMMERKGTEKEGLVGVFSMNGWIPIGKYRWEDGKAVVENIETGGLIYQPLRMDGGTWTPSGYPFVTDGEGNVTVLVPDATQEETVTLTRKHPLTKYWVTLMHDMDGVRIYGSNDRDFHHRTLLGEPMCDSLCNRKKEITPESTGTFRYVMVCPPEGKRLNVSELEVYEEGKKVECRIVRADAPLGGVTDYSMEKALDGDNLSRFEAVNVGTDFVVELERPARIDHIVYVSRNDDNYVAPGETYELFYQNGVEGWKSLGMQTATDERLVYEDVPRGALLWLHNHTRGVEEQVFRYIDGEQVFCYKL